MQAHCPSAVEHLAVVFCLVAGSLKALKLAVDHGGLLFNHPLEWGVFAVSAAAVACGFVPPELVHDIVLKIRGH